MLRLTTDQFETLIDQAVEKLPPAFQGHLADIVISIEPRPDRRTCRDMGVDDPRELLGLYQGTPLTERSGDETGRMPDQIVLYQRNIEESCDSREQVVEEVRITLLHEIGHYFGLDEDDLEEVGYG